MAFFAPPLPARPRIPAPRICIAQTPPSLPENQQDWRAFRARLIQRDRSPTTAQPNRNPSSFAHRLTEPETGALLLASPRHFTSSQPYFHRAVILLFAHDALAGTAGLLLNRPASNVPPPVPRPPAPFSSEDVRLGGDVAAGSLFALYPTPVGGHVKHPVVLPGVSLLAAIQDLERVLRDGVVDVEKVKLFTRYCGWAPGQLRREVERGVWFLGAASSDLVLAEGEQSEPLYERLVEEMGI